MDKPRIMQTLDDAHRAHQAGDFVNALKFYEHFFDHALDDDPYAYYGIRLSHCLTGWAKLAEAFPGARNRLDAKRRETLDAYLAQREPEIFHDYLAICRVLGLESDALEQFLSLHHREPKSAAKLAKYVWDDLINAEHWSVCNDLLEQPSQKLDELFAMYDEATRLKDYDPSFDDVKFDRHIVDTLLTDTQKLVAVLRHGQRTDDIDALQRQFQQAMAQRDDSMLVKQAHAKSSFLFAGH